MLRGTPPKKAKAALCRKRRGTCTAHFARQLARGRDWVPCGSAWPGRLAPQALHPVLLVGGDVARQRQARIESQVGDRGVDRLVVRCDDVEPADDPALVTGVV